MQLALHDEQLVALALHQLGHRDAGGASHYFGDFFSTDLRAQEARRIRCALLFFGVLRFLELLFKDRQLAILQLGDFVEVALAGEVLDLVAQPLDLFHDHCRTLSLGLFGLPDFVVVVDLFLQCEYLFLDQAQTLSGGLVLLALDGLALDLQLDQPSVELVHDLRLGVHLDLDLGGGLIDQVDSLVGQETVGDVAVRKLGRSHDSRVGDLYAMVHFVLLLQASQDGNRCLHRRLAHEDFLEASLKRSVFLDVFAVFVQRRCAHAMQLSACERRLEHIACVHRAFGLAGTDHGVQFVDEHDGLALVLGQLTEHSLQALFEFAAKLRACEQRGHVQRQHPLALE